MKHLVEFPLEEGGSIVVEVDEPVLEDDIVLASKRGEVASKASQTFEAALESLKPTAGAIITKLSSLSSPPDEVEMGFGLKLSAKAGAIIASAGTEANFNVKLTWKRD